MELLLFQFLFLVLVEGALPPSDNCIEPCIVDMQTALERTPLMKSDELGGQLSFSQLAAASTNRQLTEDSFASICDAYKRVDACLADCERSSENGGRVRQTYAGLRFICVEHKTEFFSSLPCLAQYEPLAMAQCRREINASLVGSNRFSEAVVRREQHSIRVSFESLCRELGAMVDCIEPVTRRGCGDDAARMMLKFITVGFASFEQLYSQLGISDQLPNTCKSLLKLTEPSQRAPPLHARVAGEQRASAAAHVLRSVWLLVVLLHFC